jgi:hypothetical protein
VARQIGKHAETLALHACDESLADEIKAVVDVGVTPEMVGGKGDWIDEIESAFKLRVTQKYKQQPHDDAIAISSVMEEVKDVGDPKHTGEDCMRIPSTTDMGWCRRGCAFASQLGLDTVIGGRTVGLIDYQVMSKDCTACNAVCGRKVVFLMRHRARHMIAVRTTLVNLANQWRRPLPLLCRSA